MSRSLLALLLLSAAAAPALACCQYPGALAQQYPLGKSQTKQYPLGQSRKLLPDALAKPPPHVASSAVLLTNFGNASAELQYWNPAAKKWDLVTISVRGDITVPCEKCEKKLKVSFNDGHSAQTAELNLGTAYGWYWWNGQWTISTFATIKDRLSRQIGIE